MLTITANGRLTREVELRATPLGKSVATVSVASDRRDRSADPVYLSLILWEAQAEAAAKHLVKGQAVTFSGRLEPREYTTRDGRHGVALEVQNVDLEYGPRPRSQDASEPAPSAEPVPVAGDADDIPF
jgi:single-strand DNA-binding protein